MIYWLDTTVGYRPFIKSTFKTVWRLSGVQNSTYTANSISEERSSSRREAARCFVSLNISLSHSRSLEVIRVAIGVS